MFISVSRESLKTQDYDSVLRSVCAALSRRGVENFIHYSSPRLVELYDPPRIMRVVIDHPKNGVRLVEVIP